ncbi:hypothetical protein B296_00018518 [Ensete ventricosum]|uniref:Lon N-terminal domain-containing protein n=1 Tax=Ensete ventricosum TaxID=4639 RepID=A0A427AD55_ENSVE|nr:hypothetical protein B296_00018518 [Ensete ventricosum]
MVNIVSYEKFNVFTGTIYHQFIDVLLQFVIIDSLLSNISMRQQFLSGMRRHAKQFLQAFKLILLGITSTVLVDENTCLAFLIACQFIFFSVTLNNIIQKNFPEEFAERKSEQENLTHLGVDIMPLFVMDVVLPCQKLSLNIFEPRYRLMVCVEGRRRFRILRYRVAEVEWIQDTLPPEDSQEREDVSMT